MSSAHERRRGRGEDRTTLCAFHHQRGVHAGGVRIRGRAPEALVFDVRIA